MMMFIVFYFMEYGPQTLNQGWMRLSTGMPAFVEMRYLIGVATANVFVAMGIVLGRCVFTGDYSSWYFAATRGPSVVSAQRAMWTLFICALTYAAVFIALDQMGPPRLLSILRYLAGSGAFSYGEIRRELFAGTIVEQVMNYTRQTSSAMVITLLGAIVYYKRGINRLAAVTIAAVVFITCSMQLNKFPLVYTLSCVAIAIYLIKTNNYYLPRRHLAIIVLAVLGVIFGLYGLYNVQYREALALGLVTQDDLWQLIFYRGTLTQADALRLWFAEFPDHTDYLGVANVGLLSGLLGIPFFDVTAYIPAKYTGFEGTTFQAGFIGSGYASFGWCGIIAYALITSMIASFATRLMSRLHNSDLRACYCAIMCLNMYFLNSRELSAALLSGGIAPMLLIGHWLARLNPHARDLLGAGSIYRGSKIRVLAAVNRTS